MRSLVDLKGSSGSIPIALVLLMDCLKTLLLPTQNFPSNPPNVSTLNSLEWTGFMTFIQVVPINPSSNTVSNTITSNNKLQNATEITWVHIIKFNLIPVDYVS